MITSKAQLKKLRELVKEGKLPKETLDKMELEAPKILPERSGQIKVKKVKVIR